MLNPWCLAVLRYLIYFYYDAQETCCVGKTSRKMTFKAIILEGFSNTNSLVDSMALGKKWLSIFSKEMNLRFRRYLHHLHWRPDDVTSNHSISSILDIRLQDSP